jgi:hypothetical protein
VLAHLQCRLLAHYGPSRSALVWSLSGTERASRRGIMDHMAIVSLLEIYLDRSPSFGYQRHCESNLAHVKDASRVTAAGGASAVPAGGGSSLLHSGGSGIILPAL